ncbi:endonuclease domain-containing protein [Candidatus Peregrinibacteria bacterium]|nr:endonuclease domain-containing protein [Candidatus Peregrinibacteria bacterium]
MSVSDHKIRFAKKLRKNMTEAEIVLWNALRARRCHRLKFRRQVPIAWYIVDFLCMEKSLVIEVDGGIHDDQKQYDKEREEDLHARGYTILRFTNEQVLHNLRDVLHTINEAPLSWEGDLRWKERGRG